MSEQKPTIAFLYAGQGSQFPGMGADLLERYPSFGAALDDCGLSSATRQVMLEGPAEELMRTENTQPAMVGFALGVTRVLEDLGVVPDYVAGLSLGEYSALAAAKVFSPAEAVELAAYRGHAMAQAASGCTTAMISILGVDRTVVEQAVLCAAQNDLGVCEISNYNCPGQTVIAGDAPAVECAAKLAREAGARRCVPLKVSGPFHTSLLAPAGEALAQRFDKMSFGEPQVEVLFNTLGRERTQEDPSIKQLLVAQVQTSVRMEEIIRRLFELGVTHCIEVGPGRVLSGLVRKTAPQIATLAIQNVEDIEALTDFCSASFGEE